MRSHAYDFESRDVVRLIGWPVACVAAFAAAMHAGAALGMWPKPRPALDTDRVILIQKAEAARSRSDAQVLVIGDSSCLMDVSATQLTAELGVPALNLGTSSYVDFSGHAALVRAFAAANPGQVKWVVLLMHPQSLRLSSPEPYQGEFLRRYLANEDLPRDVTGGNGLSNLAGLEIFRSRALARIIPAPLGGSYGRYYGFTADLERYLSENRGSAIDPDPQPFAGSAEYRLATYLETAGRAFKAAVPQGAKLAVGITPVPSGFAPPGYSELHQQMLQQWSRWLEADAALSSLPAVLPDHLFAKTTHLNAEGMKVYSALMVQALAAHVR